MPREKSFVAARVSDGSRPPAGERVAVGLLRLPDGGRCASRRGAGLGWALCRPGRARPDDLRHHPAWAPGAGVAHGPVLRDRFGSRTHAALHNTRGMGLAICWPRAGRHRPFRRLRSSDSVAAQYAPGATGNICQRGRHPHAARDGLRDRDRPAAAARVARRLPEVVGHDVPGQVAKAGSSPTCIPPLPRRRNCGANFS